VEEQHYFFSEPGGALESGAEKLADELSGQVIFGAPLRTAILDFEFDSGQPTDLPVALRIALSTYLSKKGKFGTLVERSQIERALATLEVQQNSDLFRDSLKLIGFGRLTGAEAIVSGTIQELTDRVRVNARAVMVTSALNIAGASGFISKDKDVLKLLRRQIPGRLKVVVDNGEADVTVGGKTYPSIGRAGTTVALPKGYYTLQVTKPGYLPLEKNIYIPEDGFETVRATVVSAGGSRVVGSLVMGSILPGLPILVYPEAAREHPLAGTSALLFWISAPMFVIDHTKKPVMLTKNSQDKYNTWKNIEMYTAIGSYVLNVIGSILIGAAEEQRSKRIEEVADISIDRSIQFAFTPYPVMNKGVGPGIYVNAMIPLK